MASNADPVVAGRVNGDVVDIFVSTVNMSVYFENKHVTNGIDIKPFVGASIPRVTITGNANVFYTLVRTDPEVLSPSEATQPEWVKWAPMLLQGKAS